MGSARKKAASSSKSSRKEPAATSRSVSSLSVLAAVTAVAAAAAAAWWLGAGGDSGPPVLSSGDLHPAKCTKKEYRPEIAGCSPRQCGRVVVDGVVSEAEVDALVAIADKGMALGGGAGGPTILDLNSGAVSFKENFLDIYVKMEATGKSDLFSEADFLLYKSTTEKVKATVEQWFNVSGLHLTAPSFWSRIHGKKKPKIMNDEYWHVHVDKYQYQSFDFTGLLYLSTADEDFEGGRFAFVDTEGDDVETVRPRKGRLLLFTSGSEHPHKVHKVTSGARDALTISFTCNREQALDLLPKAKCVACRQ